MQPTITLVPYGGLANRMKSLEALIALAQDTNACATAIWFKDKGLNCSFSQLFQPIDILNLTIREANIVDYLLNDRPRKKNLFIPFLFQKFCFNCRIYEDDVTQKYYKNFDFRQWLISCKKGYLSACMQFYGGLSPSSFKSFVPTPELLKRIDEASCSFTSDTVGVHIRRTDNIIAIKESHTELFVQRMKKEIETNPDTFFYLASDSTEEKNRLVDIFGNRIITSWVPTSRDTSEGIKDALVELYILSRTKKIFGSYYSTFGEVAATVGKIPYEIITKQ